MTTTPDPSPAHMTGTYDSAFQHKRVKGVDHVTWHAVKEFSRSLCVKSGWAPGQQSQQTKCQCSSKLQFIPLQHILSFVWRETVKNWRARQTYCRAYHRLALQDIFKDHHFWQSFMASQKWIFGKCDDEVTYFSFLIFSFRKWCNKHAIRDTRSDWDKC